MTPGGQKLSRPQLGPLLSLSDESHSVNLNATGISDHRSSTST